MFFLNLTDLAVTFCQVEMGAAPIKSSYARGETRTLNFFFVGKARFQLRHSGEKYNLFVAVGVRIELTSFGFQPNANPSQLPDREKRWREGPLSRRAVRRGPRKSLQTACPRAAYSSSKKRYLRHAGRVSA